MLEELVDQIRRRLQSGAYTNEAAVSIGILMPILRELGWDGSDPDQIVPEYTSGRGRVDFALCTSARRPAVFVEVKGVGRSLEGDRQLFEYAFHEGVPLCLLTDGREWSFYLPGGQGSYDERRVYRLQLDERSPDECARVFERYLTFDRVKSGQALEDASRDYRDAAARREAARALPEAWAELISEPEELLLELVRDRAEALCGFRPSGDETLGYLRALVYAKSNIDMTITKTRRANSEKTLEDPSSKSTLISSSPALSHIAENAVRQGKVMFRLFQHDRFAPSGNAAMVTILRELTRKDPSRIELLAKAVQGRSRNHIARSTAEIYPSRPDLARGAEFAPGWLVGLNIANREKENIIRAACDIYELRFGSDVVIELPNAGN